MSNEQLILSTKRYAASGAAMATACFATAFTWLAQRCDDANTYFVGVSTRYRR